MDRRGFLQTVGALGAVSTVMAPDARAAFLGMTAETSRAGWSVEE